MPASLTLFGAGSWGTALAVHLAAQGRDITLWARREEAVEQMRRSRHNPTYLPDVELPTSIRLTSDLEAAAAASPLWSIVVPSQNVRHLATRLAPHVRPGITVISLAKGIENETLQTMSQVLADALPDLSAQKIGVLSGPSHAEEVAEGRPTTVVAAAPTEPRAKWIQNAFMTDRLRIYVNTDVLGVEIGGAAKNVLAIAAGLSDGVGYGDNAKAALVTRGLAEIRRLGVAMGAQPRTFAGLAGIGDLVVTCMSAHSRNRFLGEQIGKGKTLDDIQAEMDMVAEGVRTTQSIRDLARRHDVEMPITEAVHAILFEGRRPGLMVDELMTRSAKREHWIQDELRD
ncbi:MAG: NAD(P)H-dependent glycerol-3-phosphate dehydrogenase [Salinibacter sp.]